MPSAPGFPTFFHISQRGAEGYADLPLLVAMSRPLNLWAPESHVLRSDASGVAPRDFLTLVEEGFIRVIGREEWLFDPAFRGSERWPGTSWDPEIDGKIKRLAEEDQGRPAEEQRVVAAPPEKGYAFADAYLEEHPEEAIRWFNAVKRTDSRKRIPAGTLKALASCGDDAHRVARRILRDAYNHGRAYADSGSRAPILPSLIHREFLKIVAIAPPAAEAEDAPAQPQRTRPTRRPSDLAAQMVDVLRRLDMHRGSAPDLLRFVRSEGHTQLARWMDDLTTELLHVPPEQVDDAVARRLRRDLDAASFKSLKAELEERPDEATAASVGIVAGAAGVLGDPLAITGMAAGLYPLGKGLARQLGFAPGNYDGPQWPFLYTYGKRARRGWPQRLQFVLGGRPGGG